MTKDEKAPYLEYAEEDRKRYVQVRNSDPG